MAIKNTLLMLSTYPEPTPGSAVWDAVAIAEALGAKISAIANEVQFQVPGRAHLLTDVLLNIPGLARSQAQKSIENADSLLELFKNAARDHSNIHDVIRRSSLLTDVPYQMAECARYSDLSIIPILDSRDGIAEAVIFNSGRPVLIIPSFTKGRRSFALGTAVIAWNSSGPAARAVGDALPLLEKTKQVRVVVCFDQKTAETKGSLQNLTRYLSHHGISAVVDEIDEGSRQTSDSLSAYAAEHHADLLVMGAFGHSRLREFILGGVTASMLKRPPLPIFMSH